jgi:cellulose synthase/poly-beta-1,6-N-acetylglucosamine synthase-like glycosyltransferase
MTTISIGICVYNEEKNIKSLLNSILNQKTTNPIKEIFVISSACTDRTDEIVENDFSKYPQIILLKQEKREGKASAINLFLKHASGEILVLESGDTIPTEETIEKLIEPFKDPKIGMAGGRPIPVNDKISFMGFTSHLIWELHHMLALKNPKLGELVAFRKNLDLKLPIDTAVDEAYIEALVHEKGYKIIYAPMAIVYNKGPATISDFLKQRRRIFAGHIHLKRIKGYMPSSMNNFEILKLIMKEIKFDKNIFFWLCGAVLLETYGRLLGLYDFYLKKEKHAIWGVVTTTKDHIPVVNHANPVITDPSISAINRMKLWSDIKQNIEIPILTIHSEAMFASDVILPHNQLQIIQKSSIPQLSQTPPAYENQKGLKRINDNDEIK